MDKLSLLDGLDEFSKRFLMYTLSNPLKRYVEKSTPIKKSIREVFIWMIISATHRGSKELVDSPLSFLPSLQ